jgi:type I restriction enzyme S subunit
MAAETKKPKTFYNTEIPKGWLVSLLGELGTFSKGKGILKEQVISEGLPCVRYGEIYTTHDFLIRTFKSFISDEVATESKEIKKGDILFAGSGETVEEIGKAVAYVGDEKAYAGGDVIILSTNKDVNPECLSYALETDFVKRQKRVLGQGNSVVHIYSSDLSKIKIPLPPLPEQKAIAQVLSKADAAIHTTEKLLVQKQLRKKWLLQQLLTGKKRLPAFAKTSASKKGIGGEWKEMHLGEMFTERNETKYFNLPLLSIGQNGVYPQDEAIKKDTSNDDKSKYKRICPGDIGYNTMRMWQGRSALSDLEGIVSPAYTVVTPKKNGDSLFFSYLFKMPKMTNLFWRNSQGLVDDTLNCKFKDFSIVKVVLPQTKEEQTAIAQVLQAADKEISLLKAKVAKLRELKKGLMQQLLTGKKRLTIE